MKRISAIILLLIPCIIFCQDSTVNSMLKGTEPSEAKKPVKIFNGQRAINANTTEMVGRGKMEFYVTHYFDDFDGPGGVITRFLGLDNARDVRIAFHIGLSNKLDLNVSRTKGAGAVTRLYELALKYKLMEQMENDPTHPLAMAFFASAVVASAPSSGFPNTENSFTDFSDRLYKTFQLLIARQFGKISFQLNPTYTSAGYVMQHDDKNMFALGGVLRIPLSRKFNLVIDYFHPFRSSSSKDFFGDTSKSHLPKAIKWYDPLGVGVEILTAGHIFHLNFTNNTEILESRFIPRTVTSWSKGQFRWGFTISRTFVLWRQKKK